METAPENSKADTESQPERPRDFFSDMAQGLFHSETRGAAIGALWHFSWSILVSRLSAGIILVGICAAAMVAVGQSLSIGFHAAWKVYKYWWIFSPLLGPALILFTLVPIATIEGIGWLINRTLRPSYANWAKGLLVALGIGILSAILGYFGAREDNPMLSSQTANMDALSKSVGDQSRVLGELSQSGVALLGQLNTTEAELENAKKQLSATLRNFDAQRQAAGQVTEELKRIDTRQKQIALQTEELERILEGQQPITRRDLQHANLQGLIFGLFIGFVTSFLASIAYNAFWKRN